MIEIAFWSPKYCIRTVQLFGPYGGVSPLYYDWSFDSP
jgi:hypothetical protein